MLPPPDVSPADAPAAHIEAPPGFEPRFCAPPPPPHGRCATPGCARGVEEAGDTFCGRCVVDYELGEGHDAECPCGPCAVHAVVRSISRFASTLPELRRARAARVTETLRAYIARRDGGAK